jgi:hypothetical protein
MERVYEFLRELWLEGQKEAGARGPRRKLITTVGKGDGDSRG